MNAITLIIGAAVMIVLGFVLQREGQVEIASASAFIANGLTLMWIGLSLMTSLK